jgi:membrane-bound ClpP family serine protease
MSHRNKKPALGFESMIGKEVEIQTWQKSEGFVAFRGELWSAESNDCLRPGDRAVIEKTDGLKLKIKSRKEEKA